MPHYETVFIAHQDVSSSQVEALSERFASLVKESGGSVDRQESWGLRLLQYPINKSKRGHYVLMNYTGLSHLVPELERQMRLDEHILRCLTIKTDAPPEGESVMLRQKEDRMPRRKRYGERGE